MKRFEALNRRGKLMPLILNISPPPPLAPPPKKKKKKIIILFIFLHC